ncbi:hypothetical protein L596_028158 [Steinernema carpocapsae]|uniref:Uncharacterized protein n=1 Tax=Steinernema carpocapsae TaxID=34508 RepID=A0A4U5LXQ3_STECR|nr:hypothetical protein L596_028158 [Steinernema carpocapsae]
MYCSILSTLFTATIMMVKEASDAKKRRCCDSEFSPFFCSRRRGRSTSRPASPAPSVNLNAASDSTDFNSSGSNSGDSSGDVNLGPGFTLSTAMQIADELRRMGDEFETEFDLTGSTEDPCDSSIWDLVWDIVSLA